MNGRLFMATKGTAGICSQPPMSNVEWGREGVGACSQEKGHLPSWEALQDPLPDMVGVFQFCNFRDLGLDS